MQIIHWIGMRTITSGSTHLRYKKKSISCLREMLYVLCPFSRGSTNITSQI